MTPNDLTPIPGQPIQPYVGGPVPGPLFRAQAPYGGPAPAEADEIDLREVWRVLRRNWYIILGCLAVAVALGWFVTGWMTPVYEAQATLRIDDQGELPTLEILKTLGGDAKSEVATEMEVLRSRTLAREVVRDMGLRVGVQSPRRVPRSALLSNVEVADSAPVADYRFTLGDDGVFAVTNDSTGVEVGTARAGAAAQLPGVTLQLASTAAEHPHFVLGVAAGEAAVDGLLEQLTISRPNRDAAIVAVKYRGPDPELVPDVPNLLAQRFVQRKMELKKTGATSTVEFLKVQLDTIERQLHRAEDSLQAFRQSEQVVSLETEADAGIQNLAALQAERNDAESERAALGALVNEVRNEPRQPGEPSPYRRLLGYPTLLKNPATSQLLTTLNQLDSQRGELLQRRTPQDPDVIFLTRMITDVEAQVRGVVLTYLDGLTKHVASLDSTLASYGERLEAIPAKQVQFARLQRTTQVLSDIHTMLQTRLKESEIAQAVDDPSVRAVDLAYRPTLPVAPRKALNLMLAGMLGLMVGGAGAFGREWMDTAVHTREDVQALTGVPVLGLIPHIKDAAMPKYRMRRLRKPTEAEAASGRAMSLVAGREPQSMIAEAYRTLRTNLTFARPERPPKVVVFTSPAPGDGKTTSVANLAATLAQQGLRVLAIDADMRRGFLHAVFGGKRGPGLSELLVGKADLAEVIRDAELAGGARVQYIATGSLPPNPAELLGGDRLRRVLERLDPLYDAILVDSPPINVVTDAAVVGIQADGVLLVSRAGKTGKHEVALAMEQLRNVRVLVMGTVLNDFEVKRDGRYGGYYSYGVGYGYEAIKTG